MADSTLLLVRWRRTQRAMVQASLKALRTYGGRIAGTVLTQVDMRALAAYEGNSSDVLRKYGPYKH